jgi:hypothetical protein
MRSLSFAAASLLLFGAMQASTADAYDSANRQLSIGSVVIGGATYSKLLVTVCGIVFRLSTGIPF